MEAIEQPSSAEQVAILQRIQGVIENAEERIQHDFESTQNTWAQSYANTVTALKGFVELAQGKIDPGLSAVLSERIKKLEHLVSAARLRFPTREKSPSPEQASQYIQKLNILPEEYWN